MFTHSLLLQVQYGEFPGFKNPGFFSDGPPKTPATTNLYNCWILLESLLNTLGTSHPAPDSLIYRALQAFLSALAGLENSKNPTDQKINAPDLCPFIEEMLAQPIVPGGLSLDQATPQNIGTILSEFASQPKSLQTFEKAMNDCLGPYDPNV